MRVTYLVVISVLVHSWAVPCALSHDKDPKQVEKAKSRESKKGADKKDKAQVKQVVKKDQPAKKEPPAKKEAQLKKPELPPVTYTLPKIPGVDPVVAPQIELKGTARIGEIRQEIEQIKGLNGLDQENLAQLNKAFEKKSARLSPGEWSGALIEHQQQAQAIERRIAINNGFMQRLQQELIFLTGTL